MATAYRIRMVRNTRNSTGAKHAECPLPGMDPANTFDRFLQRLERVWSQPIVHQFQVPPPPRCVGDKLLERFWTLRPEKFDGVSEPWKAE